MPDLFQDFVGRLVQQFALNRGLAARLELRGRHLSHWRSGPFAGTELIEFIPDAELIDPPAPQPVAILDAKWKVLRPASPGLGISSADVHQMVAYATRLGCKRTVLVYPWLGKAPPLDEPPVMEVGSPPDTVKVMVLAVPLLWREVGEAVNWLSDGLDLLLAP
jgi:5-methylcytosine-specific restriction endonuclease McrBC regulatory subunit McrC